MIVIKKKWIIFIVVVMIIMTFMIKLKRDAETIFLPIRNRVVAIDAGHGGIDCGARGKLRATEEEINLKISQKLRKIIEQNGGIVVLTREDNNGLYTERSTTVREKKNEDLRNRKIIVNESEPDAFVSIHLNSFPQGKYYGAQTFYKSGCDRSEKLAKTIQEEFRNSLDKDNTRVPQPRDTLYLIREVEKPAVLLEGGFLSNRNEEELLNDDKYQEKIAWAIYIGLTKYFMEE